MSNAWAVQHPRLCQTPAQGTCRAQYDPHPLHLDALHLLMFCAPDYSGGVFGFDNVGANVAACFTTGSWVTSQRLEMCEHATGA